MDLINWSLNAIDTLFSTRSLGSGEPECPGGTSPAGYTMDGWQKWRIVCLAGLSIEDTEDIYIFGTMITGFLLIGAGLALAYRRIKKAEPAVQTPPKLPAGIETMGQGATSQNGLTEYSMVKTLEKLTASVNTHNNTSEQKLDHIVKQLTAVASSQNRLSEHKNDKTTERKFDDIIASVSAPQGGCGYNVACHHQCVNVCVNG